MAISPDLGKRRNILRGDWPLYVWSVAIGFFVALVLISAAIAMHAGRLP